MRMFSQIVQIQIKRNYVNLVVKIDLINEFPNIDFMKNDTGDQIARGF